MDARTKVYRNVDRAQEWLGLEPFDLLALGALAWVLMLLYRDSLGWNGSSSLTYAGPGYSAAAGVVELSWMTYPR
jgi:hypothetical protein